MTYPNRAIASALRLKDGRIRLSGCSIENVECFEEDDEKAFGNQLVEVLLRREPTIKEIIVSFDSGDELHLNIVMTTDLEGKQETRCST